MINRRSFLSDLPLTVGGVALGAKAALAKGDASAQAIAPGSEKPPFGAMYPNIRGGDRPYGFACASRSPAYGRSGAAASAHPLATQVGIQMLKAGGSAVDAAIAMNACLGFLEPTSCGIGGDCFAMLWNPADQNVVGLAGSGKSPLGLDIGTVRSRLVDGHIPRYGAVTVSVPGAVDAWWMLHQRYGKLPWKALFEPAIAMASEGTIVPNIIAGFFDFHIADLHAQASSIEETNNAFATFSPGGRAPRAGEVFRNPDLAGTYTAIAEGGRDAFYEGQIAQTIENYFKRIGGWLRKEDLARHRGNWTKPLSTRYRDTDVYALGENTQGIVTLQMLNILENFDLSEAGFQSGRALHWQIEAKRLAFEDRARYYGDSDKVRVPVEWLISKEYARKRAALIRSDRLLETVVPGQAPSQGDTTYLTAADGDGMMVSLIQSNYFGFGSGLVPDKLGFMFQNRGKLFTLQDGHPNVYAPGKRPFQTIIPGFTVKDGVPLMSFGVMGGEIQPPGQVQSIVNRIDFGLDVQACGDSPRWYHAGSSEIMGEDAAGLGRTGTLYLESAIPKETVAYLANVGWRLGDPRTAFFGRYHSIERMPGDSSLVYAAGSDMRADGCALAF